MNKNSYNKIADTWAAARSNAIVNQPIIDFAGKIKAKGNILDIGCGTGLPVAKYLSEQKKAVVGIDASDRMIAIAQSNKIKNAQFISCDFFDFSPVERFDGVIAWDSLFHFPKKRQKEIYEKVYHWLQPVGYFLFTHGKEADEHTDKMFGQQFYYSCLSKDVVLRLMGKIGFHLEYSIENYAEGNDRRDWVVLVKRQ